MKVMGMLRAVYLLNTTSKYDMQNFLRTWVICWLLLAGWASGGAQAQVPAWSQALTGSNHPATGTVVALDNTVDAAGNVYVVGYFTGRVAFGDTAVQSLGERDIFVAKWRATTGRWGWVCTTGGGYEDQANTVATDGNGNVYVGGTYYLTVAFGNQQLTSLGRSDMFVAKLSGCNGAVPHWSWAATGGSTESDYTNAIEVRGGSVYATGYYEYSGQFGPTRLTSFIGGGIFVTKLADLGNSFTWTWSQSMGGGRAYGWALAVSANGIYLAGDFNQTATFGTRTVTARGFSDVYVAKLSDATGTCTWVTSAGGVTTEQATGVAVSGNNIYLVGKYDSYDFRAGALTLPPSSNQHTDAFLAKLTDAGTTVSWTWLLQVGGTSNEAASGVALGSSGQVYVSGTTNQNGSVLNPVTTFGSLPPLQNTGESDGFVAQATDAGATGAWTWARSSGGTLADNLSAVATTSTGVYVVGRLASVQSTYGTALNSPLLTGGQITMMVGALSLGGTWQVVQSADPGGTSTYNDVVALPSNDALVTGIFTGRLRMGSITLASRGGSDIFVARWDGQRQQWAWAISAGGPGNDLAQKLVQGADGGLYVGGNTSAGASFGATTLPSQGTVDAFVAKLALAPAPAWNWVVEAPSSSSSSILGLTSQGSDVFVAGIYYSPITFGATVLPGDGFNKANGFVAKLTDTGAASTWRWATACSGTGDDIASNVKVLGSRVFVCGRFSAPSVGLGSLRLTSSGINDSYVGQLTDLGTSGSWDWALRAGGSREDEGVGLALDGNRLYLAGTTYGPSPQLTVGNFVVPTPAVTTAGDVYVARLTLGVGTPTCNWVAIGGGAAGKYLSSLALRDSSLYITGNFSATFQLGSDSVRHASLRDVYVAKLVDNGSTGTWAWGVSANGVANDAGRCVAVGNQRIFVGGDIGSTAQFGAVRVLSTSQAGFIAELPDSRLRLLPTLTLGTTSSGFVGTVVILAGTGLTGSTSLTLNGQPITGFTINSTGTAVTFTIPPGATSGLLSLTTPTGPALTTGIFCVSYLPVAAAVAGCANVPITLVASGGPAGATYTFYDAPTGGNIVGTSTSGTYVVAGLAATTTYYVSIATGSNGGVCEAQRTALVVSITPSPTASITAAGPTDFCQGGSVMLRTTPVAGTTYLWSTGATSPTIVVTQSGSYTLTATTAAGCTALSSPIQVTVDPTPPMPIITQTVPGTLVSSATTGNQWYLNGAPVVGATGPAYVVPGPAGNGTYTVVATSAAGCASAPSAALSVVITSAVRATASASIYLIPNPAHHTFSLTVSGLPDGATATLRNALGQVVRQLALPATGPAVYDISGLASGVYLVQVQAGSTLASRRLVVE